ncbi:peptidase T [Pasteurellaceae bacterium HPA106]|uniref:peptidase T n=1 Tax=Spirabiliibacterium pneumoniae TaxID=221400 RepID=UPI001AAC5F34|nr:peptidase T [Spirabiliibacterium pneumoniae]MBE2897225.1 peptidase T [Spirabiliibacterium pneumoniae]
MKELINLNTPLLERLLRYVKVFTTSDASSNTVPSTPQQWDLLRSLESEMQKMGLQEISLDEKGYLFASLPANVENASVLGLLAHVDTAPDFNGENVRPQIIEHYDGQDIVLKGSGDVLSPAQFPNLTALLGHTLVTTDGTSLLGADDKSGIAIILSVVEYLQAHPDIPHGKLRLGFTPDEEIGRGPKHFDVAKFGADFAYTLDGGSVGELQFENFNAAEATVTFFGRSVHPGSAKDKMINGWERACEFQATLPAHLTPATSEGKEGFIFLRKIDGTLEHCQLHYALRDFERAGLDEKENQLRKTLHAMQQRYGEKCGQLDVVQHYANMREKVADYPQLIDIPKQIMHQLGITPRLEPIRGGTDGAQLSFMGLPTPNLFTGGENFHGKFEFISLDVMNQAANVLVGTIVALSKRE